MIGEFISRFSKEKPKAKVDVRGHHLKMVRYLLTTKSSPASIVGQMRFVAERNPDLIPTQDTYGKTSEEADSVEAHQLQAYTELLTLPDKTRVDIVEGQKDTICNGCAIGNHCTRVDQLAGDQPLVDLFLAVSPKDAVTVTTERAKFSDAKPQNVRRIRTTAGTLREVLRDPRSDAMPKL